MYTNYYVQCIYNVQCILVNVFDVGVFDMRIDMRRHIEMYLLIFIDYSKKSNDYIIHNVDIIISFNVLRRV